MEAKTKAKIVSFLKFFNFSKSFSSIIYYSTLQSRKGPEQGQKRVFPVKFFSQGKTCFHYREPIFSLQGPCFHYRDFPVIPCASLYRNAVDNILSPDGRLKLRSWAQFIKHAWHSAFLRAQIMTRWDSSFSLLSKIQAWRNNFKSIRQKIRQ